MTPEDLRAWGIEPGYQDVNATWHAAPASTLVAVAGEMGAHAGAAPPGSDAVLFLHHGQQVPVAPGWRLRTEDGVDVTLDGRLPPDLPLGYHRLEGAEGAGTLLVVTPRQCFLPAGLRTWGWSTQLYAARSARSWGIGDLGDLADIARWSAAQGAGMLLVNPLGAPRPVAPLEASPYFPSSRRYRNPLFLRIETVPGYAALAGALEGLAAEGRGLNADRHIDRDRIWQLKMAALEQLWAAFPPNPAFERYVATEGESLLGFATHAVLCEAHPHGPLPHPKDPQVRRLQKEKRDRILFHQWLQWLLDCQLAEASTPLAIMHDLPVGFAPDGADAWLYQDQLATHMRVGAPPDEFNTQGQDWGLPPFDPWKLRAAGYEPFIQTVRNGLRHAGALRIDHVMGLFRLFWVPSDVGPSQGTYVRYPYRDLLDILALESVRAGAYVVGEDLGTVEELMREELAHRNILSYRLLIFESDPPPRYPQRAMAAVTTHDLPTTAGLWSGSDLEDQHALGLQPNEASTEEMRHRVAQVAGAAADATVGSLTVATYEALAKAPCLVVSATFEDALGVQERPNQPGTTTQQRPLNWSLALPAPLEDIKEDPTVARIVAALAERPNSG
ncbi:MAG: 4-alpha-glucanotransferase [Actinomycetota bacterium]